jgi:hypothetical protein
VEFRLLGEQLRRTAAASLRRPPVPAGAGGDG